MKKKTVALAGLSDKGQAGRPNPTPFYLFLKDVLCVHKGPFLEVESLLPPCGIWASNSGH